ncbi:hypothetical protein ABEB36_006664 [Hypothenemus hampei]|uniref:Uncharacterized protein n=1 Tax=Hypothenemus hampei TaxID=57062 RepID=A0ABD1ERC0_HYPHA
MEETMRSLEDVLVHSFNSSVSNGLEIGDSCIDYIKMECTKCGNNDHQKSTSYLYPEQDKKQKGKFCTLASDPNFGTDLFTLLNENDVRVVSDMMIDASLYINYYFTKFLHEHFEEFPRRVEPHFLREFYYHLQSNSNVRRKVVFPKDEYYFKQMRGANRALYDASHRGYLIQSARVVYYTCMQNCVVVHMKSRIIKYFQIRYPETRTRWPATIQAELFSTNPITRSHEVAEFLSELGFELNSRFLNLESRWWSLVPFTFRLGHWIS